VTDVPPVEPPADPRDALIRAQAERIAALEAVVADLREQVAAARLLQVPGLNERPRRGDYERPQVPGSILFSVSHAN